MWAWGEERYGGLSALVGHIEASSKKRPVSLSKGNLAERRTIHRLLMLRFGWSPTRAG